MTFAAMEDKFLKYSRLYVLIFLAFLAIPVCFGLVMGMLYGFSKLISSKPVDLAFALVVIAIPSAIFATAYLIFFKRTKKHPSGIVRWLSYCCCVLALAACCYALTVDMLYFFKHKGSVIADYFNFSLLFLAGNIGLLFLLAIIQAFTTAKEADWMDKHREPQQ